MFGWMQAGDRVEVRTIAGVPAWVVARSRRFRVVRIDAHWRSWAVGGPDLECWRVLLRPALLVVLERELRNGAWTCGEVWD